MRRFTLIAVAAILTGLVVGIVIADSGGSGSATPSVPELKPPPGTIKEKATTGASGATGTTGSTTTQTPAQTTTPQSGGSGGAQTTPKDTQQHDTAPPSGSPADRFEQFCKDNPGAC